MMTVSWKIYIRVRGESLSSLRATYEKLDSNGRDNLRRTGKVCDISTSWFESTERNEIGIEIDVEVLDTFNSMNEREQESMIYELFTGAYVESWLGWFHDDLDDEDWSIYACYNGDYHSFGDGYYDGSPKEIIHTVYVKRYDIDHIDVVSLESPNKDSKVYFDVDDDSIEVNDVVYSDIDGEECIIISISGTGTKCVEDAEIAVCTFECSLWVPADEFSKIYRQGDKYDDHCVEFDDGEITIKDEETNKIEKWKLNFYNTYIEVYFN